MGGQVPWVGGMTSELAKGVWRYDLVRMVRKQRGLTQYELGRRLGIAASTGITNWETGRRLPSLPHFRELCVVLGLDPRLALGFEVPEVEAPEVEVRYRVIRRYQTGGLVQEEGIAQEEEIS